MQRFPVRSLLACVLLAVIVRVAILQTGAVSFHSDEAIVGLIAKHILDGQHRVFFWGQAYMGTLNAYPIALGFALLGERVSSIRIVQTVLFALSVGMGFATLYKLTNGGIIPAIKLTERKWSYDIQELDQWIEKQKAQRRVA